MYTAHACSNALYSTIHCTQSQCQCTYKYVVPLYMYILIVIIQCHCAYNLLYMYIWHWHCATLYSDTVFTVHSVTMLCQYSVTNVTKIMQHTQCLYTCIQCLYTVYTCIVSIRYTHCHCKICSVTVQCTHFPYEICSLIVQCHYAVSLYKVYTLSLQNIQCYYMLSLCSVHIFPIKYTQCHYIVSLAVLLYKVYMYIVTTKYTVSLYSVIMQCHYAVYTFSL